MPMLYSLTRFRNLGRKEIVTIAVKVGLMIPPLLAQRETVNATRATNMVIMQNYAHPRNRQVMLPIRTKVGGTVDVAFSKGKVRTRTTHTPSRTKFRTT